MTNQRKKAILRPAKKLGLLLIFLVQLVRLACVGATFYVIFIYLIIQGESLAMFDADGPRPNETNPTVQSEFQDAKPLIEWISITAPSVEVAVSLLITYIVMGPLSENATSIQWMKWLIRLRMFWMRIIWATIAIVYAVLLIGQRQAKFEETREEKYDDGFLTKIGLVLTAVEYACLGVVESVMKVIKVETIEKRLIAYDKEIIGKWKNLCMASYYLAFLAFALRNFSMSLYFGILSAIANSGFDLIGASAWKKVYNGMIVVLQIYLALIRGKFYTFFMRNLLSNFFWEVDDEKLQTDLLGKFSFENKEKGTKVEKISLIAANGSKAEHKVANPDC